MQHLLKVASLQVFRRKQDLPKEVYIEVITPKRTDEKQKNNQTKKLRIIELLDSMDSMGLSRSQTSP